MTHIVFQASDVDAIKEAIKLDASLTGDIIQIKDEFAVGPIANVYETEGYQARRDWWKTVMEFSPYTNALDIVDDKLTVHNLKKKLEEDTSLNVWLWMGQNQHDVCGYYWLISQLKEYQGRIFVLYLNNITLSEFEVDPDEWKKLCNENAIVRILEGAKKIVSRDETFYDKDILNAVTAEPQKLQKVLHNIFSKMKIRTGDVFLVWRIRELINEGNLEAQGDWSKGWKEIIIKLAGTPTAINELPEILST